MRGVLHRDISPSNILIKWRPGSKPDQPSMSGCVIDLDHAKKGNLAHDEVKAPIVDKTINRVHNGIHAIVDVEVEREVARLLLEFYPVNRFSGQGHAHIYRGCPGTCFKFSVLYGTTLHASALTMEIGMVTSLSLSLS